MPYDTGNRGSAEICRRLGLALTYDSGKQKVLAEMDLNQHS
ncbi:hypothetical protein GA0115259_105061, partial [Streptomyces sp. MnatMP-M17]